jgi:hypothetical protein
MGIMTTCGSMWKIHRTHARLDQPHAWTWLGVWLWWDFQLGPNASLKKMAHLVVESYHKCHD